LRVSIGIGVPSAFVAGVLSFASPCVLPLVPAYLGFLTGAGAVEEAAQGEARLRRRAVGLALAFVAGFGAVFVALGATASGIGQLLLAYAGPLTVAGGILLVLFGMHFLGLLRVPLLYRQARFEPVRRPAGPIGAALVGAAFAFGWTPCVGPMLAAILMIAGAEASVWRGAALLAAYAAGIGVPFVVAAAFTGPFLRWAGRAKRRLDVVEKVSGALLVATGIVFLSGWMPVLSGWLLEAFPSIAATP
jgi:cytochrome c-type biogenesis protein